MAQATITVTPLQRHTNQFTAVGGDVVIYHEVIGLDSEGAFVIVRSARKDDLTELVPDGPPVTLDVEFRKQDNISAALVRPIGAPRETTNW